MAKSQNEVAEPGETLLLSAEEPNLGEQVSVEQEQQMKPSQDQDGSSIMAEAPNSKQGVPCLNGSGEIGTKRLRHALFPKA